ncbi:uncharacterized protein F4812DRAFT_466420 [Daldinia caldariorum]|uniref:uncharacterized protein n=1 Tax=Daldinia caldariorum TaxID=326644 RepID=UPI002007F43E|nr:uncharacterized protein F4812DRAFT_466420 [Daldinia caldariorum]KAI1465453.1 hypothetical protein F4812DRAFT_466420 [Daldinia caldariorum]
MDYIQDIRRAGNLPYPNLIRAYATSNQERCFLEPENPSKAAGAGNQHQTAAEGALERSIKFRFGSFGSISHVYRRDRAGQGFHFVIYFRRDRGDIDHGLARSNEDIYECAKMNILRHPLSKDLNNPVYTTREPITHPLVQGLLRLNNYPSIPDAVMSGPMLPRYSLSPGEVQDPSKPGQFSKPKHMQPAALTKVFEIPELCMAIMLELGHRWGDLSNLGRTCQTVMCAINNISTRVDITRGNFLNLEFSDAEINTVNAGATPEALLSGKVMKPPSSQFLVVSNVRYPYEAPEGGEDEPDEFGLPARPKGKSFKLTAERRVIDTYRLLRTIDSRGHQIKILHLHAVPNFDIPLLKKCLERLPNLETLGVYNCELLHFGETIPFLEAVIEHNNKPGNKFVRPDFSPVYYPGLPVGAEGRTGEYGVIPSDQGLIDTRRAIVAALRKVVFLALSNNIDWFTPGTAMRQYLERIPFALGSLRYILEACYNIYYHEQGFYYPFFEEILKRNIQMDNNGPRHEEMCRTLYNDLILAVEGRPMERDKLLALTTSGKHFQLIHCAFCSTSLPAYFFTQKSVNRQADQVECCGCQLTTQLNYQVDNFFREKKGVLRILFKDERITDIGSFLNAKRTATPEELGNPKFDFWLVSVKSKAEVAAARPRDGGDGTGDLILDGRPGPDNDEEAKQVWIWKERVVKAMRYAKASIDQGSATLEKTIADYDREIKYLDDLYFNGRGLRWAADRRKNRDRVDLIYRYIEQEKARCGLAQMQGRHGAKLAANWDDEIKKYREMVWIQAGIIKNKGPRHVYETNGGVY